MYLFQKTIDSVLASFHTQVEHLEKLAEKHAKDAVDHAETALHYQGLAEFAHEEKARAARIADKIRSFLS